MIGGRTQRELYDCTQACFVKAKEDGAIRYGD